MAHLLWTKSQIYQIGQALGHTPLPPHINQRLLLYGANSKISHTHCLMALSPHAIQEVDSLIEGISRQIWNLSINFPRAGLHALLEYLGLNIPSIWEDSCGGGDSLMDTNSQRRGCTRHHRPSLPSNNVGKVSTLAP